MTEENRTITAHPGSGATLQLGVSIAHPDPSLDRHAAIFYLHGGGLIFGTRNDLPEPYRKAILERGFTLVTADYPLAPQAKIEGILSAVADVYHALGNTLPEGRTFPAGRSAGAYLALMLADRLGQEGVACPGVIDFYGYCDLTGAMRAALFQPSLFYRRSYALVGPRTAKKISGTALLAEAPLEERFGLYVYARQTGNWGSLIGVDPSNAEAFSLDEEAQECLPPLFIAASRDDKDVPFQNAVALSEHAASAETYFVDKGGHDFDRDLSHPEGMAAWTSCLDWAVHRTEAR